MSENKTPDKQDLESRIANVIERLNRKVTYPVIHPSDDWTRLGSEAAIVLAEAGAALSARVPSHSEMLEAAARGWCTKENSGKIVDPELALAIVAEIQSLYVNSLSPTEKK